MPERAPYQRRQQERFEQGFPNLRRVLLAYRGTNRILQLYRVRIGQFGYITPRHVERCIEVMRDNDEFSEEERWQVTRDILTVDRPEHRDFQAAHAPYQLDLARNIYDRLAADGVRDVSRAEYEQTPVTEENIDPENPGRSRAARVGQCSHIHNGEYEVQENNITVRYQIYTPTRGPLQGMRVIKRPAQDGLWKGFAFLGQDATLVLWQQFVREHRMAYVRRARLLIAALNSPEAALAQQEERDWFTHGGTRVDMGVVRCQRCNVRLRGAQECGSGFCAEHVIGEVYRNDFHYTLGVDDRLSSRADGGRGVIGQPLGGPYHAGDTFSLVVGPFPLPDEELDRVLRDEHHDHVTIEEFDRMTAAQLSPGSPRGVRTRGPLLSELGTGELL